MSQPLISVIVPIYNVAPYLKKCLDSLKNQTMKQIEVICIDDGSTDGSGEIADEYKSDEWPIFRIIHTDNHGLAAARNRGLDEARAEWIMFVDSDDWVELGFCGVPYEAAVRENADLVIFGFDIWKNEKKQKSKKRDEAPTGLIDEAEAHEYGDVMAWNKLFKKYLFKGIWYPDGHNYEDYATTHELVHKARRMVLLHDCLYYYNARGGSITKTRTVMNKKDRFVFMKERRDALKQYRCLTEQLEQMLIGAALGYLVVCPPCDDSTYLEAEEILRSCVYVPHTFGWQQIIGFFVWKANRRLFNIVSVMVRRRSGICSK